MPSRLKRHEAILELVALLEEANMSENIIIVEGVRDAEALRHLGFRGRIEMHSGAGISDDDLVEGLVGSDGVVVVLTDFDEEGRRLNKEFNALLERRGVKVDVHFRRAMGRLMSVLEVYEVEDLDNIDESLR